MKFVRFDDGKTGILIESQSPQVLDVAASLGRLQSLDRASADRLAPLFTGDGRGSWRPMIEHWSEARDALGKLLALVAKDGAGFALKPLGAVRIAAPLPSASPHIYSIGGNVAVHMSQAMKAITGKDMPVEAILKDKSNGLPPWGFYVYAETVVPNGAPVAPPAGVQKFDYEGEVVVILDNSGRDVKPGDINVWGYAAWNDFSIRDPRVGIGPQIGRGAFNWDLEKNFDTGNAMGPYVVVDEGKNVDKLRVVTRVSGEVRQDWNTSEMMYSFAEVAAHLSHYLSLQPTDMITSGTGPGTAIEGGRDGNRWLKPGDKVEVEVEGAGVTLTNTVAKW